MRTKQISDKTIYPNTRKPWRGSDITVLLELYEADVKTNDIATHLGRTPKAINQRISIVRGTLKSKTRKTPKPSEKSELSDDWVDTYAEIPEPKKLALTLKPEQSNKTHWSVSKQLVGFSIIAIIVAIIAYTIGYTTK
mgnify:CR=1 FL=1|jgi:hypothetical protein